METMLIVISSTLVAVFVFTFSSALIAAQLASTYSTKILDLYFGKFTKAYMGLLLFTIVLAWAIILWSPAVYKQILALANIALSVVCLFLLIPYILHMKGKIKPEKILILSLDKAESKLAELAKIKSHAQSELNRFKLSQLGIAEEILHKALVMSNYGLIEIGFRRYLRYMRTLFIMGNTIQLRPLQGHVVDFLTDSLVFTDLSNTQLCYAIIHREVGILIESAEKDKQNLLNLLGALKALPVSVDATTFVASLSGLSTIQKRFLECWVMGSLYVNLNWHRQMDLHGQPFFTQLTEQSSDKDFEERYRKVHQLISEHRPELIKSLETFKDIVELPTPARP